jgi:hypothetical protein
MTATADGKQEMAIEIVGDRLPPFKMPKLPYPTGVIIAKSCLEIDHLVTGCFGDFDRVRKCL